MYGNRRQGRYSEIVLGMLAAVVLAASVLMAMDVMWGGVDLSFLPFGLGQRIEGYISMRVLLPLALLGAVVTAVLFVKDAIVPTDDT